LAQLGELARNQAAFDERGVTLIAISIDEIEKSREMAAKVGVKFAILQDKDAVVSRSLVGIDDADLPVPGVLLIARGGAIVFRQIATSKDDRLPTAELLRIIDHHIASGSQRSESVRIDQSFAAINRWQLGIDLAVGVGKPSQLASDMSIVAQMPLHRNVMIGAEINGTVRPLVGTGAASIGSGVTLRLPFWNDLAAAQLIGTAGIDVATISNDSKYFTKGRTQLWFAVRPNWAILLGLAFDVHYARRAVVSSDATLSIGITRLMTL
jgi:hypothetical protein